MLKTILIEMIQKSQVVKYISDIKNSQEKDQKVNK